MFDNKRRIEQDLDRIRRANLPPDKLREEDERIALEDKKVKETIYEKGDFFALIIAAFSFILPYLFTIIAVMSVLIIAFICIYG